MKVRSETDFDDLVRGAKLLAIAASWTELGLWDELARRPGPVDLAELPGELRALEITAAVLAHAGLLDGAGRRYTLSAVGRELHATRQLPTRINFEILSDLTRMPEVIRNGGPVHGADGKPKATHGGVLPDNPESSRRFLEMLYRRSDAAARTTASWLATRLAPGAHVLDVGGGHGRYSEALCASGFRATLFDFPMIVELARERHGDRLGYRAGNFHDDSFGGPYDAALLSNIVHGEAADENQDLLRRLFSALAPGGWVVVKDMLLDDLGRDPDLAVFFGTTMLYYTERGRSYGVREVDAWCRAAGFESAEVVSLHDHALVFAQKPAAAGR
jgi:hypothetical protein